jgi:hypothetical protein
MIMRMRYGGFVLAALAALPLGAQEKGWDWRVTPYVWGLGIDGNVALGPLGRDVSVDFGDVLDVLSGTALIHVEAQKGEHILFGDLNWLRVEPEDEIATIGGVAEAEMDSTILELGYARDFDGIGFEAGLRYWDFDIEIDPALAPGVIRGDSWVDVFGGFRHKRDLNPKWSMTTRANLGAGGADLSVGFQIDFARELARGNAIVAGFKIINIDYEQDNVRGIPFVLDATFLGATLGFMFD